MRIKSAQHTSRWTSVPPVWHAPQFENHHATSWLYPLKQHWEDYGAASVFLHVCLNADKSPLRPPDQRQSTELPLTWFPLSPSPAPGAASIHRHRGWKCFFIDLVRLTIWIFFKNSVRITELWKRFLSFFYLINFYFFTITKSSNKQIIYVMILILYYTII